MITEWINFFLIFSIKGVADKALLRNLNKKKIDYFFCKNTV